MWGQCFILQPTRSLNDQACVYVHENLGLLSLQTLYSPETVCILHSGIAVFDHLVGFQKSWYKLDELQEVVLCQIQKALRPLRQDRVGLPALLQVGGLRRHHLDVAVARAHSSVS